MTQILFEENGVVSLGAVSKEEDLERPCRFFINAPPSDGRCDVCGRHMSELKPFGGPGDPLVGDFTGELLVKKFRYDWPPDEEAERAWDEAARAYPELAGGGDLLSWLMDKYVEEKGRWMYAYEACHRPGVSKSWECRDCIVLDDDEYFGKLDQRYQEHGNEQPEESQINRD